MTTLRSIIMKGHKKVQFFINSFNIDEDFLFFEGFILKIHLASETRWILCGQLNVIRILNKKIHIFKGNFCSTKIQETSKVDIKVS